MLFYDIDRDNNMGVVRYYLSLCVLVAHTSFLTGMELPWNSWSYVAVGGFFSLSGFLLFASFQRRPVMRHYITRRARRILPPYVLVVVASAILLVPLSSLSPLQYYASGEFWQYIAANLSFLNFLCPSLPGVFQSADFADHAVNGSLWTMKGEWICYLSIPFLFRLMGGRPRRAVCIFVALIAFCLAAQAALLAQETKTCLTVAKQFGSIFVYFFIGALINLQWQNFRRFKWWILTTAILLVATSDYNPLYFTFFRPFAISALVIGASMLGKWATFLKNHDDLSYDMYLFHFPIIQVGVAFGVQKMMTPLAFLTIVVGVTFVISFISWNLVGKKFMHPRPHSAE